MLRRHLMIGAMALLAAGPAIGASLDYSDGLVKERLSKGETVFIDFAADWCSTCAVQERTIARIQEANPAYADAITFVRVDWDKYGRSDLARDLRIPRRSTLVVLKGNEELGRIVAGTRTRDIQRLMDVALEAAQ